MFQVIVALSIFGLVALLVVWYAIGGLLALRRANPRHVRRPGMVGSDEFFRALDERSKCDGDWQWPPRRNPKP